MMESHQSQTAEHTQWCQTQIDDSQFIIVPVTYILTLTLFAISFKFYEELKLSSWRDGLPEWPSIQTSMEIWYVSYHLPYLSACLVRRGEWNVHNLTLKSTRQPRFS